jgi:predicted NBD/HSP70 family sugar kinase
MAERISTALVEGPALAGEVRRWPEGDELDQLLGMPADALARQIAGQIQATLAGTDVAGIGIGLPGVIRAGIVEESPNLPQLKGYHVQQGVETALREQKLNVPITICNDADVMAAGMAATRGQLDRLIRVWTLGNGIGFGRYPSTEGIWEGGHSVVTLDTKETYCGCGGVGHLEGIMGHRAMRLRFLDLEPEEVFEEARRGDPRCTDFVRLWHRSLAAASATSVHMDGPGRFYVTGPNARFIDVHLLNTYMQEMVKMSPLQGYGFEVVPGGEEVAIIGAAVNAARVAGAL